MTKQLPKELSHARELMDLGKFEEALEIIEQFEKGTSLGQEDLLSVLILKGNIYRYKRQHKEARKMGELAYQISQKLRSVSDSIEALLLKSYVEDGDKALELTLEAEKLLNSLDEKSDISRLGADILYRKSWIYYFKDDSNKALEIALRCLEFQKLKLRLSLLK